MDVAQFLSFSNFRTRPELGKAQPFSPIYCGYYSTAACSYILNALRQRRKERKAYGKMVGQCEGGYQREGTVGRGSVIEKFIVIYRPDLKVGLR